MTLDKKTQVIRSINNVNYKISLWNDIISTRQNLWLFSNTLKDVNTGTVNDAIDTLEKIQDYFVEEIKAEIIKAAQVFEE